MKTRAWLLLLSIGAPFSSNASAQTPPTPPMRERTMTPDQPSPVGSEILDEDIERLGIYQVYTGSGTGSTR